jgi:predicted TIM-barrel enzyme
VIPFTCIFFTNNHVANFLTSYETFLSAENNVITLTTVNAGPISGPKDAEYVLQRTKNVHGFYGASSMERLPVEEAISGTMQQYKAIQISG